MRKIELYTDGACRGINARTGSKGGWAYILYDPLLKYEKEQSGFENITTSSRMELQAAVMGLEALYDSCEVVLYSDSTYVVNSINTWIDKWSNNGWRTTNKTPVLNKDLMERLQKMMKLHRITANWVRGHSGHYWNERCDKLATKAIKEELENENPYDPKKLARAYK